MGMFCTRIHLKSLRPAQLKFEPQRRCRLDTGLWWSLAGRGAGGMQMRLRNDWRPGVSVFINDKSWGKM
jgi:hypothetical protein